MQPTTGANGCVRVEASSCDCGAEKGTFLHSASLGPRYVCYKRDDHRPDQSLDVLGDHMDYSPHIGPGYRVAPMDITMVAVVAHRRELLGERYVIVEGRRQRGKR